MNNTLHALLIAAFMPLSLSAQYSSNGNFDVALVGDTPYGVAREPAYERLIADVKAYDPRFAVHIGDTKSGSTQCDDSQAFKTLSYFSRFLVPVIYSVGDNEWTDCMRANNGGYRTPGPGPPDLFLYQREPGHHRDDTYSAERR
jgi:hypothetical protein